MSCRSSVQRTRSSSAKPNELESLEFVAKGVNWVAFDEPSEPVRAEVKVRYRHEPAPGDDLSDGGRCEHASF